MSFPNNNKDVGMEFSEVENTEFPENTGLTDHALEDYDLELSQKEEEDPRQPEKETHNNAVFHANSPAQITDSEENHKGNYRVNLKNTEETQSPFATEEILTLGEKIGSGNNGKVYKGIANGKVCCAIKVIGLPEENPEEYKKKEKMIRNEINAMMSVNSNNILKCFGFELIRPNFYIFLEFIDGKTLKKAIPRDEGTDYTPGGMTEEETIKYTIQILTGLQEMHAANIVHRDIKPENILISADGTLKIIDFGTAKYFDGKTLSTLTGTIPYMAPTLVQRKYGAEVDIWSLGCVIHEMLTGKRPYAEIKDPRTIVYQLSQGSGPSRPKDLSDEGRNFLTECYSLTQTCEILLKHNWLNYVENSTTKEVISQANHEKNSLDTITHNQITKIFNEFLKKYETEKIIQETHENLSDYFDPDQRTEFKIELKEKHIIVPTEYLLEVLNKTDCSKNFKLSRASMDKKFLEDFKNLANKGPANRQGVKKIQKILKNLNFEREIYSAYSDTPAGVIDEITYKEQKFFIISGKKFSKLFSFANDVVKNLIFEKAHHATIGKEFDVKDLKKNIQKYKYGDGGFSSGSDSSEDEQKMENPKNSKRFAASLSAHNSKEGKEEVNPIWKWISLKLSFLNEQQITELKGSITKYCQMVDQEKTKTELNDLFDALNAPQRNIGSINNFITLINNNITKAEQFTSLFDALNDPQRNIGSIENFLLLKKYDLEDLNDLTPELISCIVDEIKSMDCNLKPKFLKLKSHLEKMKSEAEQK